MAEKYKTPRAEPGDLANKALRIASSYIPHGAFLAELMQSPLETRREQWCDMVGHGLRKLEEQVAGFAPEALAENEAFVTGMLHASQIAIRNHQVEKREALRNAVLNIACGRAPDEDRQLMFLNFIDTLTPWHVRLLRFLHSPGEFVDVSKIMAGGLSNLIEQAFEELRGNRDFYDQIGKDLFSRGLTISESFHGMMTGHGLVAKRSTAMGDAFLDFISSPVQDEGQEATA